MGGSGHAKSDATAKNEVTSTPKTKPDVSNTLIENQWSKVKTNIDNLKEDASGKSSNSLDHLDQYFTEVDVPKINAFAKTETSGKKHDKIKETLVFINDMEKEIDSLIEENKKHDAFLDLTRQEKNKIQKVFTNLQQMQDQSKKLEQEATKSVEDSQKKDVKPVNEDSKPTEDAKKKTEVVDQTTTSDAERQRKDSELAYKRQEAPKKEEPAPRYLT